VVTLRLILGSAPRESGCRMLVTASGAFGSIGGGNLEYMAMQKARAMLQESMVPRQMHEPYGLGPALKQCCGGAVRLHFEVFSGDCPAWVTSLAGDLRQQKPCVLVMAIDRPEPLRCLVGEDEPASAALPPQLWKAAQDLLHGAATVAEADDGLPVLAELEVAGENWWLQRMAPQPHPLVLFGAGHVGQQVARLLQGLPFAVTWVDSRPDVLPSTVAANMRTVRTDDPAAEVAAAAAGAIYVVMTHSHALDEDICREILRRGDFCWLGLIGSTTKRRRFVHRLQQRGIAADQLERLVCPIGLPGIDGKQPATIALSVAAQLMKEKPWIRVNNDARSGYGHQ